LRLFDAASANGWAGQWTLEDTGGRLSWGCVVMHNPDIATLFDRVPEGAMVILF
jgi:lipoprotein-anchoring transpeptidase ErfK/SrfK